jgi:hypothetical protein
MNARTDGSPLSFGVNSSRLAMAATILFFGTCSPSIKAAAAETVPILPRLSGPLSLSFDMANTSSGWIVDVKPYERPW